MTPPHRPGQHPPGQHPPGQHRPGQHAFEPGRTGASPAPARPLLAVLAVLAVLGALALLAAVTGCSAAADEAPATGTPRASATATADPARQHKADPARKRKADPVEVSIPSIGVTGPLMRLGLNRDGTVEVPPADRGMTAGWYTGAAVPGDNGAAVIIGHNDTRHGRAVFHDLHTIARGADIAVRNAAGVTVHFAVTATETVGKQAFPTERVYGRTAGRELRLITCDGAFDAQGHPVDNLIVYATLR
ncbi:class F sortase [Streptomyces sp. NPDC096193]|uniref:class F sortase n=1 Tax=Streptomyces sp. NPDC096193 TaxID=3155821 RepID=UPI003326E343